MPAEKNTVDIDTSGPGAEVQLEENKKPETEEVEEKPEESVEEIIESTEMIQVIEPVE